MNRLLISLSILGCAAPAPEAPPADFSGIPITVQPGKADGDLPVAPISCGDKLEDFVDQRVPYRLYDFEGAAGQQIGFEVARSGEAELIMQIVSMHPELRGQTVAEGDLQSVELPVDGPYRLVIASADRITPAEFFLAFVCGEGAPEPAPQWHIGAGCRPDLLFLEVDREGAAAPEGFHDELGDALDALGLAGDWLCDDAACAAGLPPRPFTVEPVLQARPGLDGHRRFYQVRFAGPIRDGALCEAVETLRAQAGALFAAGRWKAGRECGVRPLGVETYAEGEMLDWHLERIGAPAAPAASTDVAIIDTGVEAVVAAELGVTEVDLIGDAERHGHGAAMALYVRQVAPEASLHSVRIMDADGKGDISDMARGLDSVLFESHPPAPGARPLTINISAGWPPELSRRRALTGEAACSTREDEVGGAVRYMLEVARTHDVAARPVVVVAAAGNRPGRAEVNRRQYPEHFMVKRGGWRRCKGARAKWFFPAEYQHACEPLAIGVGAVDAQDEPSVVTIEGAEAPLVAPGELVYAARAGAPIHAADLCTEGPRVGAAARYVLTGTSVSSALTAGVVARLQASHPRGALHTQRLLKATGARLGRRGVRRVDLARALEGNLCPELERCLPRRKNCTAAARRCGLVGSDWPEAAIAWPAGYAPGASCGEEAAAGEWTDLQTCGRRGCDFEQGPDRHSSGYVGPSPDWPGCPDCALFSTGAAYKLVAQPYPTLGAYTRLSGATLVVSDGRTRVYRSLGGTWSPGVTRVLTLSLPSTLNRAKLKASLWMTVDQLFSAPTRDVSALRVY